MDHTSLHPLLNRISNIQGHYTLEKLFELGVFKHGSIFFNYIEIEEYAVDMLEISK